MTSDTRPLRADAERNRHRVVVAARETFAKEGMSASMDDIARHAGVGVGTVYRRFPTKDTLVHAVFDHVIDELFTEADAATAEPDAWTGLTRLMTAIATRQAADRGLYDLCTNATYGQLDRMAAKFLPALEALVTRAHTDGTLRPDIQATDIGPILMMVATAAGTTRPIDPTLWRRYLTVLLDGLRPTNTRLPSRAPKPLELQKALHG